MEPDEKYGYVLEKIRLYPHNFINFWDPIRFEGAKYLEISKKIVTVIFTLALKWKVSTGREQVLTSIK